MIQNVACLRRFWYMGRLIARFIFWWGLRSFRPRVVNRAPPVVVSTRIGLPMVYRRKSSSVACLSTRNDCSPHPSTLRFRTITCSAPGPHLARVTCMQSFLSSRYQPCDMVKYARPHLIAAVDRNEATQEPIAPRRDTETKG